MRSIQDRVQWAVALAAMLAGGLIYVLFRPVTLKMFGWFGTLGLPGLLVEARRGVSVELPDFFLFSLPDGLWMFSYVSLMLLIWKNTIGRANLFWLVSVPLIALGSEAGQYFGLVPGTFDPADLGVYVIGAVLPVFLNRKSITLKPYKHEKNDATCVVGRRTVRIFNDGLWQRR